MANRDPSTASAAYKDDMMVKISIKSVPKLLCPVCNKALASLKGYVKHVKKHEPPGGFHCRYCDAQFCSEEELKRHRDAVHTIIACRLCKDITFTKEEEYRAHIRDVHNGIDRELYKCEKCGAEYKTIDPFRRHRETQCGTIKPHKCDQCSMSFVTKYNLKQHKESHTGERRFCCSYCGKNFLQKGRLVEHERSHTGEKPYKCDVCGKCFAHRESIVTHSSIHTGIRLVECKCCHFRFSCYSNLIKHRRSRPETCGLPEYDPPKNRVRTHCSRIPATLNPTSEIKVSSLNKIIKPNDQQLYRKTTVTKKELTDEKDTVREGQRRKFVGKRGSRGCKVKANPTESEEEDNEEGEEDDVDEDEDDDEIELKKNPKSEDLPKRQTRSDTLKGNRDVMAATKQETPLKSVDGGNSNEVEFPEFEYRCSEGNFYGKDLKLPMPLVNKEEIKQEEHEADMNATTRSEALNGFECSGIVTSNLSIKSEEDSNLFGENEFLDCLFNGVEEAPVEDDDAPLSSLRKSGEQQETSEEEKVNTESSDILEETEIILMKDDHTDMLSMEEDILDVRSLDVNNELVNCAVMLEDVTLHYPELKDTSSVRVEEECNTDPFSEQRELDGNDRPERGEGETKQKTHKSKRIAKLSQNELKERLKMLKKEERSWQCPHCIKIYHMRKPFEKHLRDDHQRTEEELREIFKSEEIGVVNEEIFRCHICDKIYLVEKRLLSHIKLHGPEGNLTFKCPCYCNLYFASKDEATAHAQQTHRELLYCEICKKFMTGHDSLKNHIKNHHASKEPRSQKRNLVCDKCGRKFSGRTSLTDHVRSDCGRVPLYACTICGKHLTTAGILKTHMLLHKDETPYQCEQCGKTFKVKAQYKTHIKTRHTDFKPFKCHLCPKEYPYRESLLTHMTVHTGIRRFLCNGCGKRFTCISNLQAHRKVHADTCGTLPLNAKATQYMGVQKGNLLLGAKPEAGLDYQETNTLIAKEVLDRDLPMAQELNFPSEPSAPLATVPLNYASSAPPSLLLEPPTVTPHLVDGSHLSSTFN